MVVLNGSVLSINKASDYREHQSLQQHKHCQQKGLSPKIQAALYDYVLCALSYYTHYY